MNYKTWFVLITDIAWEACGHILASDRQQCSSGEKKLKTMKKAHKDVCVQI